MCCFLAILSGGQGDKQKAKEMIDFCNADGEVPISAQGHLCWLRSTDS